jgi:hypothetical protein
MEDIMRKIATSAALMLLAVPAFAQQQQSPPILDTLNRALGNQPPQDNRSYDDYRQSANRDQQLPRDQQGRVDIRRLSDRDLQDYDQRLSDRGRYIASELRDTQDEMQRRGLSGSGSSGSSGSSRNDTQRRR